MASAAVEVVAAWTGGIWIFAKEFAELRLPVRIIIGYTSTWFRRGSAGGPTG